jgi:hypothetical protein
LGAEWGPLSQTAGVPRGRERWVEVASQWRTWRRPHWRPPSGVAEWAGEVLQQQQQQQQQQ